MHFVLIFSGNTRQLPTLTNAKFEETNATKLEMGQ